MTTGKAGGHDHILRTALQPRGGGLEASWTALTLNSELT